MGFITHLLGFFADGSVAIRVKSKNRYFRVFAVIFCGIYTLVWVGWLLWAIALRYSYIGNVCSGKFIDDKNSSEAVEKYAIV